MMIELDDRFLKDMDTALSHAIACMRRRQFSASVQGDDNWVFYERYGNLLEALRIDIYEDIYKGMEV